MISKSELAIGIPNLDDIRNIYTYGSVAYGTNNEESDEDYIIVCNNNTLGFSKCEFSGGNVNITAYEIDEFQRQIEAHEISVLECLFLPEHLKYEELEFQFKLDKGKLRESVSAKCSNSFVKCKKKLIVDESYDPYIGKKSLFHTLRMSMFGTQIAIHGKIINYQEANNFLNDIIKMSNDWEMIKAKYQPIYNSYMTEFRKVAPKNI